METKTNIRCARFGRKKFEKAKRHIDIDKKNKICYDDREGVRGGL